MSSRRRVLIIRCCRHPQFVAALARVRVLYPDAELWALAPDRFRDELCAAGIDRLVTHTAQRLGILRMGLSVLRSLRASGFAAVVLPLMDGDLAAAANVIRLAWAIAAPQTIIVPGDGEFIRADGHSIRRLAAVATLRWPEGIRILCQMLVAWCAAPPRRPMRPPGQRRRVLHIINSLGVGGAQTQIAELVNHTPPALYAIDILVLDSVPARGRLERDDVRILALPVRPHLGTMVDRILTVCRHDEYDIVHTWLPMANLCGTAAARLAGVPRIITSVRSLNPGHYPQWCQWWFRPADIIAVRLADRITVNATPLAHDHARWALCSPHRIEVVHNGLRAGADTWFAAGEHPAEARVWLRQLLGVKPGTFVIGNVGRLAVEKDQQTFVRALAEVRRRGHDVYAVIVGDGPCGPHLRELAGQLGLSGRLTFLGDRRDSRRIIAGLDLLTLTSTIEGFPNVLLEAALVGIPIVSSDVGGVRDLLVDQEARFTAGDGFAAAAAIATAITRPDDTAARTRRLRDRCRREFTTERMVARWLSLYERPSLSPAPTFAARIAFPGRRLDRPAIWTDAINGGPR